MIVLSPDALMDVERLRSFLEKRNPLSFERAFGLIWVALERLSQFPSIGLRTSDPDVRQIFVRFGDAGYVARYPIETSGDVIVTRIWHSREQRV